MSADTDSGSSDQKSQPEKIFSASQDTALLNTQTQQDSHGCCQHSNTGKRSGSLFAFCSEQAALQELLPQYRPNVAEAVRSIFEQWLQRRSMHLQQGYVHSGDMTCYDSSEELYAATALLLLQTLVYAVRADGCISALEHDALQRVYRELAAGHPAEGYIDDFLTRELSPEDLLRQVRFDEEKADIYLLSVLVLNEQVHFLDQNYLERLAATLGLSPSAQQALHAKAQLLLEGRGAQAISL